MHSFCTFETASVHTFQGYETDEELLGFSGMILEPNFH